MELYKFRALNDVTNLERIIEILMKGFYCSKFFDFNDFNEGVFPVSMNPSGVNLDEKLEYKICSLSKKEALSHHLMWGHYANSGMGVAIQIKTQHDNLNELNLFEVNYNKTLKKYKDVKDILINKSEVWEYEKEVRYLNKTNNPIYEYEVSKVLFGTPFKYLGNYQEIINKNKKLSNYLDLKKSLEKKCEILKIAYEDYDFA